MADQYVTREIVRPEGFLSRLFSSIIGVFFGFLLIIGAVVLLYWNDGRYDISNLARTAIPANAEPTPPLPTTRRRMAGFYQRAAVRSRQDVRCPT